MTVIERWHWEEVQLLSLTTVTTTATIKCTCKHTDELPIRQYWLHWLYIVHVTAFLACLRLLDSLPRGTPNLWVHPMATSQPNSPGDLRTVRARRSVAQTAKAFRTKKIAVTTTFNNWQLTQDKKRVSPRHCKATVSILCLYIFDTPAQIQGPLLYTLLLNYIPPPPTPPSICFHIFLFQAICF